MNDAEVPGGDETDRTTNSNVEEETMTDVRERTIACRLPDAEQDRQWEDVASDVFEAVEETRELADGWAFRFPGEDGWVRALAEYVLYERGCCPFMRFEIVLETDDGPAWLHLRGGEDVKRFVSQELRERTAGDGPS
jgi:hypothetical protein